MASLAAWAVSAGIVAVKATPLRGGLRPALTAPYSLRSAAVSEEKPEPGLPRYPRIFREHLAGIAVSRYPGILRLPTAETGRGDPVAQRIVRIDDLDESENAETVRFSIDGQDYEIDLAEANRQRFYQALEEFIRAARRVTPQPGSRGRGRRQGSNPPIRRQDIPQIREWAMGMNMDVSRRGRIKKEIIDAYDEAHK
jgi:Lsr2